MRTRYSPSKYTSNLKFDASDIDKWADMYESGISSVDIAREYGTSSNTVRSRLRAVGVVIRSIGEVKLGELNPNWVGDEVKYFPLHKWVKYRMPKPELCEKCEDSPPRDLANKGTYDRDLSNWEWLCRRCHMLSDGRMKNLKQYAKR